MWNEAGSNLCSLVLLLSSLPLLAVLNHGVFAVKTNANSSSGGLILPNDIYFEIGKRMHASALSSSSSLDPGRNKLRLLSKSYALESRRPILRRNNFAVFRNACGLGDLEMVKSVVFTLNSTAHLYKHNSSIRHVLSSNNHECFRKAAEMGHLDIVRFLVRLVNSSTTTTTTTTTTSTTLSTELPSPECTSSPLVEEMLAADNYAGFRLAGARGIDEMVEMLFHLAPHMSSLMLESLSFEAFRHSAYNNHLSTMRLLYSLGSFSQRSRMIDACIFSSFRLAAGNGHGEIIQELYSWASNSSEIQAKSMLESGNFEGFRVAGERGHLDIVRLIWSWTSEYIHDLMIRTCFSSTLTFAAYRGHRNVSEQLLQWADNDWGRIMGYKPNDHDDRY